MSAVILCRAVLGAFVLEGAGEPLDSLILLNDEQGTKRLFSPSTILSPSCLEYRCRRQTALHEGKRSERNQKGAARKGWQGSADDFGAGGVRDTMSQRIRYTRDFVSSLVVSSHTLFERAIQR